MPPTRKPRKIDPCFILADAVAIAHCVIATLVMIVGEVTPVFANMKVEHPGVTFIYRFLDWPIHAFLSKFEWFYWLREYHDRNSYYLGVMFVIVTASVAYGVVVFVVSKIFHLIIGKK